MDTSHTQSGHYPPGSAENRTDKAKTKVEQLGREARQEVEGLSEEARAWASAAVDQRRRAAADEIHTIADALHETARRMHDQPHPSLLLPALDQVANSIDRLAGAVREQDLGTGVRQLEDFARRQPGLFLGGAFALGFALTRFLRSSAQRSEYAYVQPRTAGEVTGSDHPSPAGYTSADRPYRHEPDLGSSDATEAAPESERETPPPTGLGGASSTPSAGFTTSTQHRREP